jgi:hypothetical protein
MIRCRERWRSWLRQAHAQARIRGRQAVSQSASNIVVTDRGKEISDAAVTGATAANPRPPLRFAVCIDNGEYRFSLELHKIYRLVPDDAAAKVGQVRVIDESGSECLYPAAWFTELRIPRSVRDSIISGG